MRGKFWWVGALGALPVIASPALGVNRYVNASLTTGANNGGSWANAYRGRDGLARALAAASSASNDVVWVARGTYVPSITGDRAAAFVLKTNVDIVGGFAGGETDIAQRDPTANPTILSGDLNADDNGAANLADNSFHLLSASGVSGVDIFGLVVRGGNANGAQAQNQDRGGGLIATSGAIVVFTDCTLFANRCTFGGGAGYINGAQGIFRSCHFISNFGGGFGGAFDTNTARTTFTSCTFRGNSAGRAGALEVFGTTGASTLANCLFIQNTASNNNGGGAIWTGNGAGVTLFNCTITRNAALAAPGGGINATASGTVNATNTILYGNTGTSTNVGSNQLFALGGLALGHCCIPGTFAGPGNIAADPLLLDDASLRWGSPCIDAGRSVIASDFPSDVFGNPRLADDVATPDTGEPWTGHPMVDIGAHEFQGSSCVADLVGDDVLAPDGAVTIDDLLAMILFFDGGALRADLDNGSGAGAPDQAVTIDDLVYFLGRFEAGC